MKLSKILLVTLPLVFINTHAEILKVEVAVGGMVCTACVSIIKKALTDKVPEVSEVENVDLGTGTALVKLKERNALMLDQLQKKLVAAFQKSTYKLENIKKIIAKGTVKKDDLGYFLLVTNSKQRINLPSAIDEQASSLVNKMAIVNGSIEKNNGSWDIADDEQASLNQA